MHYIVTRAVFVACIIQWVMPLAAVAQLPVRPGDTLVQQQRAFEPGARVRITEGGIGNGAVHVGTVVARTPDTVTLKLDRTGETFRISRTAVETVELSRGRKAHVGAGIGYGFLIGAGAGALTGVGLCTRSCERELSKGAAAILLGGLGAGVGLVVGGLIGAIKTEQWDSPSPGRWSFTAGPARGGFAVALSARF